MKNILVLAIICFVSTALFAQALTEKPILQLPASETNISAYSIKYDKSTGSYAYQSYDTATKMAYLICPKGNSGKYSGVNTYNAWFDKDGNVYCAVYNTVHDTIYTYYLLKNTEALGSYQYINDNFTEKNGVLYFVVKENDKTSMAMLDIATGKISKDKAYDDIQLVYYPQSNMGEGEPNGAPGVTPNGKIYYVASDGGRKFVVIDGVEQKRYMDIDPYYFTTDKNGELVYVANDKGNMYEALGATFVVQGTREYPKFDNVYGPIIFDNNNVPMYIAGFNTTVKSNYPQQLMMGDNPVGKRYTGGVNSQQLTPSGKIAFIGTNVIDSVHFESFLVFDGVEGQKFGNIYSLSFDPAGTPMYVAQLNNKQYLFKGKNKISEGADNISDYKLLADGKLTYISANYGNYDKNIADKYFVHIGDEKLGPYEMIYYGEEGNDGGGLMIDDKGNYVYQVSKLIDKKNYKYEVKVYSNDGSSAAYDFVENTKLVKGKPFFMGYKTIDKVNYTSIGKCYYDYKPISQDYDNTAYYSMNNKSNTASFVGCRKNELYYVEIKF